MIPVVQVILALAGTLFTGKILTILGLSAPSGAAGTEGRAYVMSDHPAARAPTAPGAPAAPPAPAAPGTGTAPSAPPVKQIVADTVRSPWSVWGIAALCLTLPLAVSQFRAAAREASDGASSIYREGRSAYSRVDNADDFTGNKARRRR